MSENKRIGSRLRWFELRDLPYCFVLPILAALSWGVPQRYWPQLCKRLVGLFLLGPQCLGQALVERVRQATRTSSIALSPEAISSAYVANKLQVQLEYFRALRPDGWSCDIRLVGREHLESALAIGKGAILWVIPANSSDIVVKRCFFEQGVPFSHLSALTHGYSASQFGLVALNGLNRLVENKYLAHRIVLDRAAPHVAMNELRHRVGSNEIVSMTAVENKGGRSFQVGFFDCKLPIGAGPISVAYDTQAALLPVFCLRQATDRYVVEICPPIEVPTDRPKRDAIAVAFEVFGSLVQDYAARAPDQWYGWTHLQCGPSAAPRRRGLWDWIHKVADPASSQ